jgi:pSer/pThr/pTyr-binding forkhead associated (FHA) protein
MMGANADQTVMNPNAMGATIMDDGRTQIGGTATCPICQSLTSTLDKYCGECGFLMGSVVANQNEQPDEVFAYLIDRSSKQKYPLHEGVNTIGRMNADIQIAEGTVSRAHAKLTLTSGTIILEDLGSSNGTKVGNDRLVPGVATPIGHGSKIRFGTWRTIIQVVSQGEADDEPDVPERTVLATAAPPPPPSPTAPPSLDEAYNKNVALSTIFGASPVADVPPADPAPASPFAFADPEPEQSPIGLFGNIQQEPAPTSASAPLYDYDAPQPPLYEAAGVIFGTLNCTDGSAPSIQIMDGTISIGRKVGNDVVLANDSYVSGRHALLRHDDEGTHLIDVGSTNGTTVNGKKLDANRPELLFEGDEVQIGKSAFVFQLKSGA